MVNEGLNARMVIRAEGRAPVPPRDGGGLPAAPGLGDELLEPRTARSPRDQRVPDHEGGGPPDAELFGKTMRLVQIGLDGRIRHVLAEAVDVESKTPRGGEHRVLGELPTGPHNRFMELEIPSLLLRRHRRASGKARDRPEYREVLPTRCAAADRSPTDPSPASASACSSRTGSRKTRPW